MRSGLTIGNTGELFWIVDPTMTITLGGNSRATIFSTPNMIMLMERAAREALRPYLEEGEESVGIDVNVEHLGPAPLGAKVVGRASVTAIDKRKIEFNVEAYHGDQLIGRGKHRRAVILLERFLERLPSSPNPAPKTPETSHQSSRDMLLPTFQTLQVRIENRIAWVTLNRPKSLNAVNVAMTNELDAFVKWLFTQREAVRVVILTGSGDAFCSGDDVKELPSLSLDEARALSLQQANIYLTFEQLPQPIIAAVNGPAYGGGCVAAYSCDFRIASQQARFGMPEIKLGWPPGYGISQLTNIVGKPRALELCLTGESISAQTALEWGLVHQVVPRNQLLAKAQTLASKLLQMPAEALRQTKILAHADEGQLPKVTHRADTEAYLKCLQNPDSREGIAAFLEKRPPRFQGE
jgi:enoyl-CoA hydratase